VQVDRRAAAGGDDDVADLLRPGDPPLGAHDVRLAPLVDGAGAHAGVVPLEGGQDLGEGDAVGDEARRVGLDQELPLEAADGVHARHAGHGAQLRAHHPFLDGAEIGESVPLVRQTLSLRGSVRAVGLPARAGRSAGLRRRGGAVVFDDVDVDLPEAGGDGTEAGLGLGGDLLAGFRQPLQHLLAGEVDVDVVAEDRLHLAEAVARERPGGGQARDARQGGLQGEGNLLFHLGWTERRVDRGDLDDPAADVGHRVDGQAEQGKGAIGGRQPGEHQHQPAVADAEIDDPVQHVCTPPGAGRAGLH